MIDTCRKCGAGANNPKVYRLWTRNNFSTCFYCGATPRSPISIIRSSRPMPKATKAPASRPKINRTDLRYEKVINVI